MTDDAGHNSPADDASDENGFRLLAENSTDMLSRATPEAIYLYVSPVCEQLFGWAPEELVGRNCYELFHSDDLAAIRSAHADVLEAPDISVATYRFRHKDGSWVWAESAARNVRDRHGEIREIHVATRDVTARKEAELQLRRSETLHRSLTENLPDTTLFLLDHDLRVLIAEGEAIRRLPWFDEDMFRGRLATDLIGDVPEAVLETCLENYRAALDGEARRFEFTSAEMTFALHAVPVRDAGGDVESALVIAHDITASRVAEQQLARRTRQQEAVARLGQVALRDRSLGGLMDEIVAATATSLDMEFSALLELTPDGSSFTMIAGAGWDESLTGHYTAGMAADSQARYTIASHRPVIVEDYRSETRFRPDPMVPRMGITSAISVVVEGTGQPFGVLGAHSVHPRRLTSDDVNFLTAVANLLSAAIERHRDEQLNRHAALHDPLTGLPNRTLVLDRLEHALARRRREGTEVAALMLDLDGFKVINDSLGHGAGDELLLALAPRLQGSLRPNDSIGRLGGDEFVAVCELMTDAREAVAIAERIGAAVSRPFGLESGEHFVTGSIGIAIAAGAEDTPESLLRDADAAMYRAKARGRGRYELFDDAMRAQVLTRLRTETELRRALDREELRIHYQPIVDVADGRPVAAEALVRWEHPEHGLIGPLDFIPVAEETGLIIELGRWVLEQACDQVAQWQKRFLTPLHLSVNVSGRQIANPLFPAEVAGIARASGLAQGTLALEITESVLIEEADSPLTVLNTLHEHGLRLELDDFGTGYSSLSYLKRFPLDGLKIDRSFVEGIEDDPSAGAIIEAVIQMSLALKINVVTEGVETAAQLQRLRQLGCDRAQGYYFSRPLGAEALEELLETHLGPRPSAAAS